jgi:hypothetical protein
VAQTVHGSRLACHAFDHHTCGKQTNINLTKRRTGWQKFTKTWHFSLEKLKKIPENSIRKCSSRAFEWMVMSVGFDNLKTFWGNFCVPPFMTEVTISPYKVNTRKLPPKCVFLVWFWKFNVQQRAKTEIWHFLNYFTICVI